MKFYPQKDNRNTFWRSINFIGIFLFVLFRFYVNLCYPKHYSGFVLTEIIPLLPSILYQLCPSIKSYELFNMISDGIAFGVLQLFAVMLFLAFVMDLEKLADPQSYFIMFVNVTILAIISLAFRILIKSEQEKRAREIQVVQVNNDFFQKMV